MDRLNPSLLKGALAGIAGGLAGAAFKIAAEKMVPPRLASQPAPPVVLAEQVAGHPLPQAQQQASMQAIHWTFGALTGMVYGCMVEYGREPSLWRGAAFGLAVNKLTHESLLPQMGLSAPPAAQRPQERISEWFSHAVFGLTTEVARRSVRKLL